MSKRNSTRREFTKQLVALAAAPLVAGEVMASAPPVDPPTRPADAADALAEAVRLRYGKHLSEDQLDRVRRRIASNLRSAGALRRPALRNADEPDFTFFAELP
jgi:hypothetical protein